MQLGQDWDGLVSASPNNPGEVVSHIDSNLFLLQNALECA
jgi:hypothetical protein